MKTLWLWASVLLLAACADKINGTTGAPDLELGRKVYNFRCYYCHGYSGDARTLAASFVSPPPRNFTGNDARRLTYENIVATIANGRSGTAMAGFSNVLSRVEIDAVTRFVIDEFISKRAENTRYHTAANGWPDHERYRSAFPFARGELPIDAPAAELSEEQLAGRQLFMSTCVSCHDRSRVNNHGPTWELRSVSYPPNQDACVGCHRYATALHGRPALDVRADANVRAPYDLHDTPPRLASATPRETRGETMFQRHCAFCHAADGTGRNWIGAFLEPHPRDLTAGAFHQRMTHQKLVAAIQNGIPDSAMPAWKHVLKPDEINAIAAYVLAAFRPSPPVKARR